MSDIIIAAIIAVIPSVMSMFTYRKIKQVHVQINSRVDQMIALVRSEATATERVAGLQREQEKRK